MKFSNILLPLYFLASNAHAQATYQWDPNGAADDLGGAGTWNDTNAFWDEVGMGADDGTATTVAYTFLTGDTAVFGGTPGTVSPGIGTMEPNITFTTGGYVFSIGGNGSRTYSGLVTIAPTGITRWAGGNNSATYFSGGVNLNGGHMQLSKGNNGPGLTNQSTFSGGITGSGTLEFQGLSGATEKSSYALGDNDYSGTTLLTGGFTNATHANAFGTSAITFQGGSIENRSGGDVTLANNTMTWKNNFQFGHTLATVQNTGSLNLGTGAVTMENDITITARNLTLTVGGDISDGGNGFGLTKAGDGELIIEGATSYSGNTTVTAGTLTLGSDTNPSNLHDGSTVTINGDGVLNLPSTGTDFIAEFLLNDIPQPAGSWGAPGSGADFETPAISGNGLLNVASGANFASWAAGFGIPNSPTYDGSDNDGIPALVEYALGLSPLAADYVVGTFDGNTLTFNKGAVAVANGDVSYAIETSQLLTPGSWTTVTPTLNDSTSISYTLPAGQSKLFARLIVTQN